MDFKNLVAKIISNGIKDISYEDIYSAIEVPSDSKMGDFAFPCFKLSKILRKAPNQIASEVKENLEANVHIDRVESQGAYINFYVNKTSFISSVLQKVIDEKSNYGSSDIGCGRNIVIDYSSPNIAKPFHVGHLRSTVIGNSLYKIYDFLGYKSIGINHLGDWGTQFGKLIVGYKNWGNKEEVQNEGIQALTRIYVKFHEEAEKNEALNDEARTWLVKMQQGEEEALSLWKWFNDISLSEFNRIYDKLGIKFDYYTGESFYNDKMDVIVEELRQKQLLKESEGAMIVNLEDYNMPPCLILRKDGGTLYPTRDIAAAKYRKETYDFYKCLIITAIDQNLHFSQWFKVIDLMGYSWAEDLVHVPFGLVSLETGKLSTRKGNVVLMEDLLNEAIQKTLTIIEEKNPSLPNKEEVARKVGIGAMIFNDLYNNRIKSVTFSWDNMLNFNGETGPYVQYTHARTSSVLDKGNIQDFSNVDFSLITDDCSIYLVKQIMNFPNKISEAAIRNEPYILSRHLIAICQAFNKFYDTNKILGTELDLMKARLLLVYCTKTILATGLSLIGIEAPAQM